MEIFGITSTAAMTGIGISVGLNQMKKDQNNSTKRTSEAFEGRTNAELVERALGDHDFDK